ncbi:MAG: choice-of-anchor J domain-containing protein [Chitinophagales bacterium]|nr:choice-of-anchor J domain-containing protein [Chitinophagales bacterium]MDW8428725.1 choice-of-anchor J domain-containing protein [Chitinophagales bacterium]
MNIRLLSSITCLILSVNAAIAQTTFLFEDFEDGTLPVGWTNISNATDGGWKFGNSTQLSSTYFQIPPHTLMAATNDDACNCNKADEYLITPQLDLSGATIVYLTFDAFYMAGTYQSKKEEAHIKISTNGGSTWTTVFTLPGYNGWFTYDLDLSAYAGQSNVQIAFNYKDGSGWLYGWAIDNVHLYEPVIGVDMVVSSVVVGKNDPRPVFVGFQQYLVGMPLTVMAILNNKGTVPITSFDVMWTDGTNTINETVTGISIPPLGTYTYTSSTPYLTQTGYQTIWLYISNINNGSSEISTTNNSKSYTVYGVTPNPDRKYLAEEATGTWCGWCPRGTVFMDYMTETYPEQFVGIAVHNGDPMANATYDNGVSEFPNFAGYPSVIVDRSYIIDPQELENDFISRVGNDVPVKVSVEGFYNPSTKKLEVKVTGEFLQNLSGNFRFNAVVVEDSVKGSTAGYNQANFYAGGGMGSMGGYENLPSTVPASMMVYNHVGRAILGGFLGTPNSLPTTINAGDTYSYVYQYSVPSFVKIENVHLVGMITQYISDTDNKVLNCNKGGWQLTIGVEENELPAATMMIYPNPADEQAMLRFRTTEAAEVGLEVRNHLGQLVITEKLGRISGEHLLPIKTNKLPAGTYTITLVVDGKTFSEKLFVQ